MASAAVVLLPSVHLEGPACEGKVGQSPGDVLETRPNYMVDMCGRVIQSSGPLHLAILDGMNVYDSRVSNYPPRYNGAPSQELFVIRRNRDTGQVSLDPLRWGLIPYWCKDPKGGRKSINAKTETVASLPMFREADARRRCILPVDGFFEWKAIKGLKAKQPFAIAMRDGSPFGIAGTPARSWASIVKSQCGASTFLAPSCQKRVKVITAALTSPAGTRERSPVHGSDATSDGRDSDVLDQTVVRLSVAAGALLLPFRASVSKFR
jgi:putative SOS response-associated peptidase YedK